MVVKKGMTRVNANKAIRKMNKLRQKFEQEAVITLEEVGEFGKGLAIGYAPFRTGITAASIVSIPNPNDVSVTIRSKETSHDGPRPRKALEEGQVYHGKTFKNFSLVRWMHTSPKAKNHIRTGSPEFMKLTKDELADVTKQKVTGRWRNVVMKLNNE